MEVRVLSTAPKFQGNFALSEQSESKGSSPSFPVGWCVYILICEDGSYYVGLSNDLTQRLYDHAHGKGPTYTKQTRPKIFAWYEPRPDRPSAHSREQQLKGWTRAKKDKLTKGVSPYNFGHPIWRPLTDFKSPPASK